MVMAVPHFFLDKLEQAVNQYFMHILSLLTDNNLSWMIQRKGVNDRKDKSMIHLHKSMGPGRDRSRDPWICSQTRYRLVWHPFFNNYVLCTYVRGLRNRHFAKLTD